MLHELRTYTFHPGKLPAYLKVAEEIGRPVRGNNYGMNHGYWTSEFGQLNQIWHLWSYASYDERARLRAALSQNERWTKEYVPAIRPLMQRQDIRLLNPISEIKPPAQEGGVYELRIYRMYPGMAMAWATKFKSYFPIREKYSRNVGLWVSEAGQPNEALHLWNYPSLNARAETRARLAQDKDWQAYLAEAVPMIQDMQSIILLPTSYSAMK
jgi:hypothetical protein